MSEPYDPTAGPFEVLGVPRSPTAKAEELERRMLSLSREHHPDHAGGDPGARARATLRMAQIHEAYALLKDPERRAEYLLSVAGGPTAEQDKSVPDGFLEHALELRMEVEEAREEGGAARETLEVKFRDEMRQLRNEVAVALETLASEGGGLDASDQCVEQGKRCRARLNEMSFIKRLLLDLLADPS